MEHRTFNFSKKKKKKSVQTGSTGRKPNPKWAGRRAQLLEESKITELNYRYPKNSPQHRALVEEHKRKRLEAQGTLSKEDRKK